MAIIRVDLKNFLVFKGEFTADFCPGVNVVIGENGTGKTTLLKVLYRLCGNGKNRDTGQFFFVDGIPFNPINRPFEYIRMETVTGDTRSRICVKNVCCDGPTPNNDIFVNGEFIPYDPDDYVDEYTKTKPSYYSRMSTDLVFVSENNKALQSVFIPAINLLPHSKGLVEMIDTYEMSFDVTQIDILRNARLSVTKLPKPNCSKVIGRLSDTIGGEVLYEEGSFYLKKVTGEVVEFALEASGYTRLGLLWKLLRNGLLEEGSILFWDEPENSLNRELVPDIVDVLLTLSHNGVQIFLATHDYHFARYFDVRKNKNIPVKFHRLSKTESGKIDCASSPDYTKLTGNPMERASEKLYESVISDAFGVDDNE